MMRGVKAVLFDLDETLIDSPMGLDAAHCALAKRLRGYLRERGIDMDEAALSSKLDDFDDRMNMKTRYNRGEWWPILFAELGLKGDVPQQIVEELTKLYWDTYSAKSPPYPDVRATLEYLKERGYKLGIVSDTDGKPGMKGERLKNLDFMVFFEVVAAGGDDTPKTKPNPESFLLAASRLGVRPAECVVVGDKPFTDIKGGKAAGMRTIWVRRRDWGVEESADFIINSLSELKRIL